MQFLCEYMKIDCEIDCDARGRRLNSYLEHQITQGLTDAACDWHVTEPNSNISAMVRWVCRVLFKQCMVHGLKCIQCVQVHFAHSRKDN